MDIFCEKGLRVLVFGGGGGGDVVTATFIALKLRCLGYKTFIAAAPWERFVVDPAPGPISIREVHCARQIGEYSAEVNGDCFAVRGGQKVVFQAVNVSQAINEPIFICELNSGVEGLYRGLKELIDYLDLDVIIGVDVGGDIIAEGFEKELWSPLADQITLSALYRIEKDNLCETLVAIASIGADGELPRRYILKRISLVAKENGLLGAFGFGVSDLKYMYLILSKALTEAGKTIPDAIKGYLGYRRIRKGSRIIYIDVISTIVFLLKTDTVFKLSSIADKILYSKSIDEANQKLIEMGIFTELELEKELSRIVKSGGTLSGKSIVEIKQNWFKRIRK